MNFFSSSTAVKNSTNESVPKPYQLVTPDADDAAALRELEISRYKWNAFLRSKTGLWEEQWLWDNRNSPVQTSGPLRKKFLQMFNSKVKMRKKIKALIRAGVPPELRGKVWSCCAGSNVKKALASPDEQYSALLPKLHKLSGSSISADIEKDLLRTFPDRITSIDSPFIVSLRNVLHAYALRNHRIGYCQSMNYLCGLLLLHMDEETSFWTLAALIEDILPPNYYSASLLGGRIDQQVFQSCLAWKLPKVYEVLRSTNTMLEPVICPWFLCLFVNVIPLYSVCRIWDCLFWEGSTVLFRIGLTMVKSKSYELLEAKDFIGVYSILKLSLQPSSCSFVLEHAPDTTGSTVTRRNSLDDSHIAAHSLSGSSATMSDSEFLMQSAFGYRWLRSVPQSKVDELRKRFLVLLTESDEAREHEYAQTASKAVEAQGEEDCEARESRSFSRAFSSAMSFLKPTNSSKTTEDSCGNPAAPKVGDDNDASRSGSNSPMRKPKQNRKSQLLLQYVYVFMLPSFFSAINP